MQNRCSAYLWLGSRGSKQQNNNNVMDARFILGQSLEPVGPQNIRARALFVALFVLYTAQSRHQGQPSDAAIADERGVRLDVGAASS